MEARERRTCEMDGFAELSCLASMFNDVSCKKSMMYSTFYQLANQRPRCNHLQLSVFVTELANPLAQGWGCQTTTRE